MRSKEQATGSGDGALTAALSWPIVAVASWFAAEAVARAGTPVDAALPLLALGIVVVAMLTRPVITFGIPLLLASSLVFPETPVRLLAFGVVMSATFCTAVVLIESAKLLGAIRGAALAVLATLLLRWIPLDGMLWGREFFLALLAAAITAVLGGGPAAIAAGVVTVFFTPSIPMRTLWLPLLVLVLCSVLRLAGMRRMRLTFPAIAVLAPLLLFFAWSGVVARSMPLLARGLAFEPVPRYAVNRALAAGVQTTLAVPADAIGLIVSGANVPRLHPEYPLGVIEPGGRVITVADAPDWGFLRLEHLHGSRNALPRDPAGSLHGYGYRAWVDAAGRVLLPRGAREIRVIASPKLPGGASLQVEGFEVARK